MNRQIKVFPNIEELNNFAAEKFVEIAAESVETRGFCNVALAGGSTPKALYQLLASDKFRDKIFRKPIYYYFGDERNVLPNAAESNFRMAKENLFEPLRVLESKIARWETELESVEKTVENYLEKLRLGFALAAHREKSVSEETDEEKWFPRFDLILLGMGADGHTASLFPYTEALRETEKPAAANYVEKLNDWRFTLTFPTINNARNIIFLVAGEEKAATLREVLEGEFLPEKFPSQNVKPARGNLFWLLDEKAASLLNHK